MQRILSGLGITGSQVMSLSGCRAAFADDAAASFKAPAAMADFKSGNRSRSAAPRSTASAPSIRPQLAVPLILKLANFIGCPGALETGNSVNVAPYRRRASRYRTQ